MRALPDRTSRGRASVDALAGRPAGGGVPASTLPAGRSRRGAAAGSSLSVADARTRIRSTIIARRAHQSPSAIHSPRIRRREPGAASVLSDRRATGGRTGASLRRCAAVPCATSVARNEEKTRVGTACSATAAGVPNPAAENSRRQDLVRRGRGSETRRRLRRPPPGDGAVAGSRPRARTRERLGVLGAPRTR